MKVNYDRFEISHLTVSILDSIEDAALVIDMNNKIIICNQASSQILGCNPDEIAGQTIDNLQKNTFNQVEIFEIITFQLNESMKTNSETKKSTYSLVEKLS